MKICLMPLIYFGISFFNAAAQAPPSSKQEESKAVYHETMESALKARGMEHVLTEENRAFIDRMRSNYDRLEQSLKPNFGGAWVAYDQNKKAYQIIAITKRMKIDPSLVTAGKYKVIYVKYTLSELKAAAKKLVDTYLKSETFSPKLFDASIDVMNNRIVVGTSEGDIYRLQKILFEAGFDMNMMTILPSGPVTPAANFPRMANGLIS
jgi:hypothetical protein